MIDLLFIALFQSVAVEPAAPPAPVAEVAAPVAATADAAPEVSPDEAIVCRMVRVIGSRMPVRRCTSASTDEAVQREGNELARQLTAGGRNWNPSEGSGATGFMQSGNGKR